MPASRVLAVYPLLLSCYYGGGVLNIDGDVSPMLMIYLLFCDIKKQSKRRSDLIGHTCNCFNSDLDEVA